MMASFFLPQNEKELQLYFDIRDNPKGVDVKRQIEQLWSEYRIFAPKGFQKNAQVAFYQRWWEMYLNVGLTNLGISVKTCPQDKGPDIKVTLDSGKVVWIEAIAPNPGKTNASLPSMRIHEIFQTPCHKFLLWLVDVLALRQQEGFFYATWHKFVLWLTHMLALNQQEMVSRQVPRHEFLLRLTQALAAKQQKFEEYKSKGIITDDDICIIAISACALNQWGSLMEKIYPQPILSIVAGAGHQRVTLVDTSLQKEPFEIKDSTVQYQPEIHKKPEVTIDTAMFSNSRYQNISGILYSYADILNAPAKPENTFQLFLNHNADNSLPIELFNDIKIWQRVNSRTWERS